MCGIGGFQPTTHEATNSVDWLTVMHAPKRGFGMGVQERDVLLGPWKKQADDVFNNFPLPTMFERGTIQKMWKDAKNNESVRWDLLSKLFAIGTWFNKCS